MTEILGRQVVARSALIVPLHYQGYTIVDDGPAIEFRNLWVVDSVKHQYLSSKTL